MIQLLNSSFRILIVFCLIGVSFSSCKKKDDSAAPSQRNKYIDATFDGKAFKSVFTDTSHVSTQLQIMGSDYLSVTYLILPLTGITIGKHDLNISSQYGLIYGNDSNVYIMTRGQINITRNDNKLEGSFDGVGESYFNVNDSVVVTNGQFSYQY
jgi:hypothetical protein